MQTQLLNFISNAYAHAGEDSKHLNIGLDSEGVIATYYNNHSDNWLFLGNLNALYTEAKLKFPNFQ